MLNDPSNPDESHFFKQNYLIRKPQLFQSILLHL